MCHVADIFCSNILFNAVGKNDGSVDGHRYFTSSPNRGVFVRPEDISLVV